ncbi:3-deoxy-7-phosphoheptulonate synthase [Burkholderia mayonis]|uniref:Phospho-2-dehydro-3-deoxyheptonate aldolase n=1 Tax=Burkholderia mayonis TaxID=1385591 RepID=A0A1B4FXY3_9BURK|nr:3-deoxy-7-phosphoheptulonate synthase [Burkholderia mayonis]AOJ08507.1 phospho-2-dehydro-3-deoxyheptonate aldolase [Burkholderia mayonis]KVE52808.1 phospho-2-dehydro-3-deoxyheptonate aldolase [Burkholderia mayonis]
MKNITLYPNGGVAGSRASVARQRVGMRLPTPAALRRRYPLSATIQTTVDAGRRQVQAILEQRDPRWLAIVGPCSIHDPQAALDYALHLARLADAVRDAFCVVMRVYFEKPRTTVGWKGLINDPRLDGSHRIDEGLATARRLLCEVNALGLPAAIEALDLITPHYLGDLVSWAAIGARTTESQVHREMASGLPMPVGFKNGTDGGVEIAIHAMQSSMRPHAFIGLHDEGYPVVLHTDGNPYAHLVLRGGRDGPNYDAASVATAEHALRANRLPTNVVIDCSHANCDKQHARQVAVLDDVVDQICAGNRSIRGVMLESFLEEGRQSLDDGADALRYGCSITDPCLGWDATEAALVAAHARLAAHIARR